MEKLNKLTESFFKALKIDIQSLEIKEEKENIFLVSLDTNDSGFIIGQNGKTLDNIQTLLRIMVNNSIDKNYKITLKINDYILDKDKLLDSYIKGKIDHVNKTGQNVELPYFSAYERKKIHTIIHKLNDDTISTKSSGEGSKRRLTIIKQAKKLTIDIDGDDI